MFKSIYNGFWILGEAGYRGPSHLNQNYYISESRPLFNLLGREWGFVHHTPRDNEYNTKVCKELFLHFNITMDSALAKTGAIFKSERISLFQLNDRHRSKDIGQVISATTPTGKHVGDLAHTYNLLNLGIDPKTLDNSGEGTTCCIGFNPAERKWYGWSHRAIYGFGIGSTVKKGDCAYKAATMPEWVKSLKEFYERPRALVDPIAGMVILSGGDSESIEIPISDFPMGKGEWTAQNLSDAKQMARDFAEGIS